MKIKVTNLNGSQSAEVEDTSLSEFTENEIDTILPQTNFLHKINFDHVYSTGGISSLRLNHRPKESKSLVDGPNTKSRPVDTASLESRSETWTDDTFDDVTSDESFTDDSTMTLNADSIQQVFERMLDMTSLDEIANQTANVKTVDRDDKKDESNYIKPALKKVVFVDTIPGTSKTSSTSGTNAVTPSNKLTEIKVPLSEQKVKTRKPKKSTKSKKTKEQKIGKSTQPDSQSNLSQNGEKSLAQQYAEAEREMNILLQYTRELLVKRWGEYLTMTTEKIRSFEIENAKQQKMVTDVIEMLEDKDLYVWQLIDDLQFF